MALGNTRENGVRTLAITRVARSAAITKRRLHVRQYGPNYLKGNKSGGRGEIRTHERLATVPVFKTGALNHSATLPCLSDKAFRNMCHLGKRRLQTFC